MELLRTAWNFINNARYLANFFNTSKATVISIENPHDDYYVIKLKPAKNYKWHAGEHVMLKLPDHKSIKREYRMLSIASIVEEGFMLFGTRTGKNISAFKKELISLNPNDSVSIQGAFGWFRIRDNHSPIVMFAGGVGVTPVRALVKALENDYSRPIYIVYSAKGQHLFGEEMKTIADNNPMMTLYLMSKADESQAKLEELVDQFGRDAYYYMSSSPKIMMKIAKLIRSKGIPGKRLIDDTMRGY